MARSKGGTSKSGASRIPKKMKQDKREGKFCIYLLIDGKRHYVFSIVNESFSSRKAEACFFTKEELKDALPKVRSANSRYEVFFEKWEEKVITKNPILLGSGCQDSSYPIGLDVLKF